MKAYRTALHSSSRPEQMNAMRAGIERILDTPANDDIPNSFRQDTTDLPHLGSDLFTDKYSDMPVDAIYASLGFPDAKLQGMTEYRDTCREYERWDTSVEAKDFWSNTPVDRRESTKLSWLQVVGIHFASSLMVTRQPFFLFDGVGMGSTAYSAGVIMMRPWLRSFFKSHGKLPTSLGELPITSNDVSI